MGCRRIAFDQAEAVLELGDSQLEVLELGARDEAELLEEAFQAGAGAFAHTQGLAAPPVSRLLDQLPRLVAAHAAGPGELVGQGVRPIRGQRDGAESGEADPLERVDDRVVVTAVGHAASRGGAGAASRASTRRQRTRPVPAQAR